MSDELMCCCPPCLSDCGTSRCHFHGLRGLQARRMSRTMRSIPGREQRAGSWPCQPLALSSPSHKLAGWHMRTTRTHAPTHTCVRARARGIVSPLSVAYKWTKTLADAQMRLADDSIAVRSETTQKRSNRRRHKKKQKNLRQKSKPSAENHDRNTNI